MKNKMQFRVAESWDSYGFGIFVFIKGMDTISAAQPLVFNEYKIGERTEPIARIDLPELQQLMDELWRNGIRPSNGEGNVGQIGAMDKHLADMRAIVSNYLGVDLKK